MINKKALIIDPLDAEVVASLREILTDVNYCPKLAKHEILEILKEYQILILRSGHKIDRSWADKISSIEFVLRAGVGTDNIDINFLLENNIKFYNFPTCSTQAVAEYAILAALSLLRKYAYATEEMNRGIWNKSAFCGSELSGKNVGLIGFGKIGQRIFSLLHNFEVNVYYTNNNIDYRVAGAARVDRNFIAEHCSVIFIQIPLKNDTYQLIDKEFFSRLKSDCYIINLSRFEVMDMDSLYEYMKLGKILGAVIDPIEEKHMKHIKKFQGLNINFTPHIAAFTKEAQNNLKDQMIETIKKEYQNEKHI